MGFIFGKRQRDELLIKAQETLVVAQDNNMRLAGMLESAQKSNELLVSRLTDIAVPAAEEESHQEQISPELVAYALNICMVSVSQIVEYNDLRIMEQEYEGILNNLNLQRFPKDEALLEAIKQILDSITFFKVQAGEKKRLEEEYQHKIKNAIWKAIPGFGIVPGGGVAGAIISVIAQAGIGYMNYRNAREEATLENKRKLWELERAAIEQFNGLRRELFETAWRLSKDHGFEDKYRLTERLISQYNQILMEPEPLRRYQRLLYIYEQGKFDAYPPILYHIGHAANEVYLDSNQENVRYLDIAKEYLWKYIKWFNKTNELLREDMLLAQACLECYDLLSIEEKAENRWLITKAQEKSGNALDVQQMCALAYLDGADYDRAARLLMMLVNEHHNKEINAQMLSIVYALQKERLGTNTYPEMVQLQEQCKGVALIRMPESPWDLQKCFAEFVHNKRFHLCKEFGNILLKLISEFQSSFVSIWITAESRQERYIEFLLNMGAELERLCQYPAVRFAEAVAPYVCKINQHIENANEFTAEAGVETFTLLVCTALEDAAKMLKDSIANSSVEDLVKYENDLWIYRRMKGQTSDHSAVAISPEQQKLESAFFGQDHERILLQRKLINECLAILRKDKYTGDSLYSANGKKHLRIALMGDMEFQRYWNEHKEDLVLAGFGNDEIATTCIVALFNSRRWSDLDILFTTSGVAYFQHHELLDTVRYSEIRQGVVEGKKVLLIGDTYPHNPQDLNAELFVELCTEMNGVVSGSKLNVLEEMITAVLCCRPQISGPADVILL